MSVSFDIDFNYSSGAGMSWMQWERLLTQRIERCSSPQLPDTLTRSIWESMAEWVALEFFVGTNTPLSQYEYWVAHGRRRGMYGAGSPTSGQPDHIINAWEILGGGDATKALISREPMNADVASAKGPPFLGSMWGVGPVVKSSGTNVDIEAHTLATMTPYDPSAGGTRPIMHYLKKGWSGDRAFMRARWPNGLGGWLARDKPYEKYLGGIQKYLLHGR